MTISWDCEISKVNVTAKRADVKLTRTDDATQDTWDVPFSQVMIETPEQKTALYDLAWAEWEKAKTAQEGITNFLDNMEQAAKSNLEAREV